MVESPQNQEPRQDAAREKEGHGFANLSILLVQERAARCAIETRRRPKCSFAETPVSKVRALGLSATRVGHGRAATGGES